MKGKGYRQFREASMGISTNKIVTVYGSNGDVITERLYHINKAGMFDVETSEKVRMKKAISNNYWEIKTPKQLFFDDISSTLLRVY